MIEQVLVEVAEKKNCKNAEGKGDWKEVPTNLCFGKREIEDIVERALVLQREEFEKMIEDIRERVQIVEVKTQEGEAAKEVALQVLKELEKRLGVGVEALKK